MKSTESDSTIESSQGHQDRRKTKHDLYLILRIMSVSRTWLSIHLNLASDLFINRAGRKTRLFIDL